MCPLGRFCIRGMYGQLVLVCFLLANVCNLRNSPYCITLHASEPQSRTFLTFEFNILILFLVVKDPHYN